MLGYDDVEYHLVTILGEVIGRWHESWHIMRAGDQMPALVLFCHTEVDLDYVYRLCHLMLAAHVPRGYLVTMEIAPSDVIHAARSIGIVLLDAAAVEILLQHILEVLYGDNPDQHTTPWHSALP